MQGLLKLFLFSPIFGRKSPRNTGYESNDEQQILFQLPYADDLWAIGFGPLSASGKCRRSYAVSINP